MTAPPDDDKVGYRRPPRKSRWKKGQSGNPRKKPKPEESIVDMIDRLLLQEVRLTLNGEVKTVPALVAIVSQLQLKEMAGSARASKILLKYRAFASQHTEKQFRLIFKDSEDAGAVASFTSEAVNG
jgi:Family of unknown function (DUF5681)